MEKSLQRNRIGATVGPFGQRLLPSQDVGKYGLAVSPRGFEPFREKPSAPEADGCSSNSIERKRRNGVLGLGLSDAKKCALGHPIFNILQEIEWSTTISRTVLGRRQRHGTFCVHHHPCSKSRRECFELVSSKVSPCAARPPR